MKLWRQEGPRVLSEIVYRAVPPYQEVTFEEVADTVRNDYGMVTDRTIFRHLRRLQTVHYVERVGERNAGVYVRPTKPVKRARRRW